MQIPEPKFKLTSSVSYNRGKYIVLSRSYNENEGWLYNLGTVTIREAALSPWVECPFPTGSRVCHKIDPNKIYLVDGQLLKFDRIVTQVSYWSSYVPAPKFKIGDKLWHNVHGAFTVNRIYWFTSPTEKGCWAYNDNFEHNLEYAKNVGPFKPGDRIACKNYPEKVGRVAENYDILIDLDAPKDVAGQVVPNHIVVWSAWAPEPKFKLPLAIKHKHFPDNIGYATRVVWEEDRWEYHGPKISGTFEENVIDLSAEITKIRMATAIGGFDEGNQKIIELFLGECKND